MTKPADAISEQLVATIKSKQAKHPKVRVVLPYVGPMEATAVKWLEPSHAMKRKFPALEDVEEEIAGHVPMGKVGSECILVDTAPPHAVFVFMEQLWPLAASLDAFFAEVVLKPGEKTPMQKLAAVRKEAVKLDTAKKHAAAVALLRPALDAFTKDPDPKREDIEDHEEEVADAWNSLGVCLENAGDLVGARAAYVHAAAWGLDLGALNYCDTWSARAGLEEAVAWVSTYLVHNHRMIGEEEEATVRAFLVTAQLEIGATNAAHETLTRWLESYAKSARRSLWPKQRVLVLAQMKKRGVSGYDAARLDALAAPRLNKA